MIANKKRLNLLMLLSLFLFVGCQKLDRPALGDYPQDVNPPGGPLKFYVAFDGTSNRSSMNAVDSILANFPTDNPLKSIDGISGKAVQGEAGKFIKYARPNDWAAASKSFTLSFWIKRDGQTKNNINDNGAEFIMSFKSNVSHWSGANMFVLLEGNNAACAIKTLIVDKSVKDAWLNWEGGNAVSGLLDNKWHHIALVYDAGTSTMTLYQDGIANSNKRTWTGHGDINLDESKITEMRVGCGPANNFSGEDWLSSSWKGGLDQFRMYAVALSPAEVTELYNNKK